MNKIKPIPWQSYREAVFANITSKHTNIGHFALVSVFNPHGNTYSKRQNLRLAIKVKQYLKRRGIEYQEIWAGSKDMAYRELTLIIKSSYSEANKVAFFAKQNAFHYVRNSMLFLIPTNQIRRYFRPTKLKNHQIKCSPKLLKYGANQAVAL